MALLRGFSVCFAVLQIIGASFYLGKIGYEGLNFHGKVNEKLALPLVLILHIKIIIAACLLLKGIFSKRPGYFLYWLIYNGIIVCFCSLFVLHVMRINKTYLLEKYGTPLGHYIAFIVLYWIKWIVIYWHYKQVRLESNFGDVVNTYSKFENEDIQPVMKV